ncbi:MAG: RHS repeat-associated core domain-containing protein [Acidobacteriota bacterium]
MLRRILANALRRPVTAASICGLLSGSVALAQHPNQPQGFAPERSYQESWENMDHVDLFSGRLSATIPLGPFSITYNTNVWRYQLWDDNLGFPVVRATPDEQNTGGLGWHLGWGEIYHHSHWYNTSADQWLYVDGDGSRHYFYQRLHRDDPDDGDPKVLYSRDGSYLRMRLPTGSHGWVDIEEPDGTRRRFVSETGGLGGAYRITKVWSRFASINDPDLTITYNEDDTLRTMTDRFGRSHRVLLSADHPWLPRVVTRVETPGFDGTVAAWNLTYEDHRINVSCKNESISMPERITVPLLVGVQFPDGTSLSMKEGSEPLYHDLCSGGIDDLPGALTGVNLPTGGKLRWEYQEYEFPPGDGSSVFNTSAGVSRRRMLDPSGAELGLWTYRTVDVGAQDGNDPEMRTDVVDPTGHCSRHLFNARYTQDVHGQLGWERGLPFVYREEVGGMFLSSQVFTSHTVLGSGARTCSGEKVRSTYLRFRRDTVPGSAGDSRYWYETNRQLEASRIVYHDDGDRYEEMILSDFDGLGNFRRRETRSNFADPQQVGDHRIVETTYHPAQGTYPSAGYTPIAPSEPWILGLFDSVESSEPAAEGVARGRTEYVFDADKGVVVCTRTLAGGDQQTDHDLLRTFTFDALGQVTDVKTYGGDLQATPIDAQDPCAGLPSEPVTWTSHEYHLGERVRSYPVNPNGQAASFLTYDVDIDSGTGLVATSRDTTGFETVYDYDAMGRLTTTTPEQGSEVRVVRTPYSSNGPAKINIRSLDAGAVVQARTEIEFDAFGRPKMERHLLPDGLWTERQTRYNARGWVTAVSEWGDLQKRTEFLDHDPFGRPETVRRPAGAGADVQLAYKGSRLVTSTVEIALESGPALVGKQAEKDAHGRLRRVEERSGPGGAVTVTTYRHDVGGRLTEIRSGPVGQQQIRTFEYDSRGFLLSETDPEKGALGNGTVQYLDHDARGLPGRILDGPNQLGFTYDAFGRPTETRDLVRDRLLVELEYDGAPGRGLGKVWRTTRHNYLDLPFNTAGEEDVRVRTTYEYHGLGGAASEWQTALLWSPGDVTFTQTATHDELGNLLTQGYPTCSGCAGSASSGPQLDFDYEKNQLVSIAGWVDDIVYDDNGQWAELRHANGAVDLREFEAADPDRVRRLRTLVSEPGDPDFDTGTITYDGAGNIQSIGGDTMTYDEVGRLASSEHTMTGCPTCTYRQRYRYDRFGNLLAIETVDDVGVVLEADTFTVDPATNRVTDCSIDSSPLDCPISYDTAGNVTALGGYSFEYDPLGRMTRQAHELYLYDAEGERIAAITNAPGTGVQLTLRGVDGQLLSKVDYDGATYQRNRDYIYAGERLVASADGTGATLFHYHLDHLGSPRLLTRVDGSVQTTQELLPYGREVPGDTLFDDRKLSAHERDFATGVDAMHARTYLHSLGRFFNVDPERGDVSQPQRLNRYAYALGNPMGFVDPDGRAPAQPKQIVVKVKPKVKVDTSGMTPGQVAAYKYVPFQQATPWVRAEKQVIYGVGLVGAVGGGLTADVSLWGYGMRWTNSVEQEYGGALAPVTTQVFQEYVEAVWGYGVRFLGFEGSVTVVGKARKLPLLPTNTWGDGKKPVSLPGFNPPVQVPLKPPEEPKEPQNLYCHGWICVPGGTNLTKEEERELARLLQRLDQGTNGLHAYHCLLSPTTCGGGGSTHGWSFYRKAY